MDTSFYVNSHGVYYNDPAVVHLLDTAAVDLEATDIDTKGQHLA